MQQPRPSPLALGHWVAIVAVLLAAPLPAQVGVEFWTRDDGLGVSQSLDALEKSRAALLQARQSVDAALMEVDLALATLRSSMCGPSLTGPLPAPEDPAVEVVAEGPEVGSLGSGDEPADKEPEAESQPADPATGDTSHVRLALQFVTGAFARLNASIQERFAAWKPHLDEMAQRASAPSVDELTGPEAAASEPPSAAVPVPAVGGEQSSPIAASSSDDAAEPEPMPPSPAPFEAGGIPVVEVQPDPPRPIVVPDSPPDAMARPSTDGASPPDPQERPADVPSPDTDPGLPSGADGPVLYREDPPSWLEAPMPWDLPRGPGGELSSPEAMPPDPPGGSGDVGEAPCVGPSQ